MLLYVTRSTRMLQYSNSVPLRLSVGGNKEDFLLAPPRIPDQDRTRNVTHHFFFFDSRRSHFVIVPVPINISWLLQLI